MTTVVLWTATKKSAAEKKSDFLKEIMSGDSGEIDELLWDQIIGKFNTVWIYFEIFGRVNFFPTLILNENFRYWNY